VQYSIDGGQTWRTLLVDWPQTSAVIDLTELPGSTQALFRVIAGDGVWIASDESDGDVSVPFKAPVASIVAPFSGAFLAEDQNLLLRGEAWDPETPSPPDAAFQWRSDRDGALGEGRSLLLSSLSTGMHIITLTVTDDQGLSGSASITLYVGEPPQRLYLPLVGGRR
ncbi:MAG: hypothetical protein GXP42_07770, partial [Chloroflexi bacterium]|nr:hypothetical protein [Chloroflexota bacterium]